MKIELWGFGDNVYFGLPQRAVGLILLSLELAAVLVVALALLRSADKRRLGPSRSWIRFLAFLLLLAPIGAGILVLRIGGLTGLPSPMVPSTPEVFGISILGTLCWMLAAARLGTPEALAVAFAFGLVRGGWQTHSVLEPLQAVLQAAAFAALLRMDWDGYLWRWMRHPIIAGGLSGILSGLLHSADLLGRSLGTPFDAMIFAFSWLPAGLVAGVLEGGGSAAAAFLIGWLLQISWKGPQTLRPSPFGSEGTGRLLIGLAAVLLAGMVALGYFQLQEVSAAIDLERTTRMEPLAEATRDEFQLFIQTGRLEISEQAARFGSSLPSDPSALGQVLDSASAPSFFDSLAVVDSAGEIRLERPTRWITGHPDRSEVKQRWALVLRGIPADLYSPPGGLSEGASMMFFSPILPPGVEVPVGGMAGKTDLRTNGLLAPWLRQVDSLAQGEVYLTDFDGKIVWAEDDAKIATIMNVREPDAGVSTQVGPDGTLRLVHAEDLEGYSWRVVIATPLEAVAGGTVSGMARGLLVLASAGAVGSLLILAFDRRRGRRLRNVAVEIAAMASGGGEGFPARPELNDLGGLLPLMRDALAGIEKRQQDIDVGVQIDRRIASGGELSDLLPGVLEILRSTMAADLARLVLAPEVSQILALPPFLQSGFDPGQWQTLDRQIVSLCSKSGPLILENPSRAKSILDTGSLSQPIEALLAQSLRIGEGSQGVVWFGYHAPRALAPAEVAQIAAILEKVSALIAKEFRYRQTGRQRQQVRAVLDSLRDPVFFVAARGDVIYANPAGERLLKETSYRRGAEGEPAVGFREALKSIGIPLEEGEEIRMADGRAFRPEFLEIGRAAGSEGDQVCVLRNVSEQDFEDRLRASLTAATGQDARASLEQLLAYGRMLSAMGAMSEQQRELIRKTQEAGEVLDHLLKDLLLVGSSPIRSLPMRDRVELGPLLAEIAAAHSPQARNRQIRVVLDQPDPSPAVEANRLLMRQALSTLVGNAILSTGGGGIVTLMVRMLGADVEVRVADTGRGIAPADLGRILAVGSQETLEGRKDAGIGAGIRMARDIVVWHGGTLSVDSRLGAGTVVVLHLPLRRV